MLFESNILKSKKDLYKIYAYLDNLIIQLTSLGEDYKGYVLIYFSDKTTLPENKSILNKFKTRIFKLGKIPLERIFVIESGRMEQTVIEFYLLPKRYPPPAPNPTLPSPQFMKRK